MRHVDMSTASHGALFSGIFKMLLINYFLKLFMVVLFGFYLKLVVFNLCLLLLLLQSLNATFLTKSYLIRRVLRLAAKYFISKYLGISTDAYNSHLFQWRLKFLILLLRTLVWFLLELAQSVLSWGRNDLAQNIVQIHLIVSLLVISISFIFVEHLLLLFFWTFAH